MARELLRRVWAAGESVTVLIEACRALCYTLYVPSRYFKKVVDTDHNPCIYLPPQKQQWHEATYRTLCTS